MNRCPSRIFRSVRRPDWARAGVGLLAYLSGVVIVPFLHTIDHARGVPHTHDHGVAVSRSAVASPGNADAFFAGVASRATAVLAHERLHRQGQAHDHGSQTPFSVDGPGDGHPAHGHSHPHPDGHDDHEGSETPHHGSDAAQHLGIAVLAQDLFVIPDVVTTLLHRLSPAAPSTPTTSVDRVWVFARGPPTV